MKSNHSCQSCGMPLKKDERDGKLGLDARYCSFCFHDGDFAAKGMSAVEFRDMTQDILRQKGWWRVMAWAGTRMIPSLPRWKQADPDQI